MRKGALPDVDNRRMQTLATNLSELHGRAPAGAIIDDPNLEPAIVGGYRVFTSRLITPKLFCTVGGPPDRIGSFYGFHRVGTGDTFGDGTGAQRGASRRQLRA